MQRFILSITLALLISASAQAQGDGGTTAPAQRSGHGWGFGVYAGALFAMHSGGFTFPEAQPPRIAYDEGSGIGPAFGVRVDIPLTASLSLSPRLFAECRRGTFTSDPFLMQIIGQNLEPQDMQLEDELDVILRVGGLDLLVQWYPAAANFYLAAGPSIGLKLYEDFTVTGRIVAPAGVTYLDGSREKEMYDGDPDRARSLQAGIRAGAGYTFSLGRDLAAGAEVLYLFPFQTVTETDDWKIQGVLGSVSFLFTF